MAFDARVNLLATAIGAQIKSIKASMGGLTALTTANKTSLVAAINEVAAASGSGGADPWLVEWKTAAVTNSTVTGADAFTGFAPAANTRYIVDVFLIVTAAAITTGVQTALLAPTSGMNRAAVKIVSAATSTTDKVDHLSLNSYQVTTAGITTPTLISIQAIIDVGAAPGAGNVRVGLRSEVAGSAVVVQPGSSMRWRVAP